MFDDDIPANALFFSITGSTYRRQINSLSYVNSERFRVCLTVPILEYLHEVKTNFLNFSEFLLIQIYLDAKINR